MKRFFSYLIIFLLVCALSLPAFASAPEEAGEGVAESPAVLVPDVVVNNEINFPDNDLGEYVGTSVYSLNPISPNESNGLKRVMLSLIGDWDSIVVEHQYENYNGSYNYVREIQLDYPWLCSCAIFLVVLFCVLRGGFACLCKQ